MKKIIILLMISTFGLYADKKINVINTDIKNLVIEVVKRNPTLIFDRMQKELIQSQINLEKSVFDPTFYVNLSRQSLNTPNTVDEKSSRGYLDSYYEEVDSKEIGLKGVIAPYGSQWNMAITNTKKQSNLIDQQKEYTFEYQNGFQLSVMQPLLKGYGEYGTLGKVHLTEIDKDIYQKTYEKNIMDMIGKVTQTYWKYYAALELKKSYENSISLNQKIVELLTNKADTGEIPYSEVLEVKSSMLIREAEIQKINSEIEKYKNNFLTLLNLSSYNSNLINFNLLEKPNILYNGNHLDTQDYFQKALLMWPEFAIAQEKLKREQLQIKITENFVKPQLDLTATVSTSTLNSNRDYSLYDDEHHSWSVGLQYAIPFYDTQARSALKMAKIKKNQVALEIQRLENGLYNAIDAKIKSYYNSKKQVEFYKNGLDLKEELLDYTNKAFEFGEKSIRDVIVQEDDMIDYKIKFFNALIDLKLSKASLDKAIGMLFDNYLSFEKIQKIQKMEIDKTLNNQTFGVIN